MRSTIYRGCLRKLKKRPNYKSLLPLLRIYITVIKEEVELRNSLEVQPMFIKHVTKRLTTVEKVNPDWRTYLQLSRLSTKLARLLYLTPRSAETKRRYRKLRVVKGPVHRSGGGYPKSL